jgi:hypothetical protein
MSPSLATYFLYEIEKLPELLELSSQETNARPL